MSDDDKDHAKAFLLAELEYLTDSFWKNEQTGETRVNWFIGLVTAVVAALVALATSEEHAGTPSLRVIVIASLLSLLALGTITLLRVLKRNETTDEYKRGLDHIRQLFRDRFDGQRILQGYLPFPASAHAPRKFGGLTHIVAVLNSLLFAGIAGTTLYPVADQIAPAAPPIAPGWAYLAAVVGFVLSAAGQFRYIRSRAKAAKKVLHEDDPTHAGGIVYRLINGAPEYLLVGPSKEIPDLWLFPKGHIEKGELHGEAALREVQEEAGVRAWLLGLVGASRYEVLGGPKVKAKYYLMEALYETRPTESRRKAWFSFERALAALTHEDNKRLLIEAERQRGGVDDHHHASSQVPRSS